MKILTRLHVEDALAASGRVALSLEAAHKLRAVLRAKPGETVALFNARDGEWLARIEVIDRDRCETALVELLRAPEPSADLWLVFALVKRPRLELMVEKAVELGASALFPVTTARSVPERINETRLAAIAREAAEQSERLSVPPILATETLVQLLARWPKDRRLIWCDETGEAPPIAAALAAVTAGPLAVLIGPEGGFAESELDALRKTPNVLPVGLGPRVLRSETAAMACLSVVQALAGDWRVKRARPSAVR